MHRICEKQKSHMLGATADERQTSRPVTKKNRRKRRSFRGVKCSEFRGVSNRHFGQVHTDSFPTPEEIKVQTIGTVRSPYKAWRSL